jgi:hypothetical protein
MTLSNTNLMFPAYVANSAASVYANVAGHTAFIRGIILHNANTTTETVVIHFVVNSSGSLGTAAATNLMYKLLVAPDETVALEIPFSFVMTGTNDTIVVCGDYGT